MKTFLNFVDRLFLKDEEAANPHTFDGSMDLMQWIQSKGIYLGLEGCLEEFDELTTEFMTNTKDRDDIGKRAKVFMDRYGENGEDADAAKLKSAKYYIKVMAKIVAEGEEWVNKEGERLSGIVTGGNMNIAKRPWFIKRLNILSTFANPELMEAAKGDKSDL